MGLDQYLKANRYIGGWDYDKRAREEAVGYREVMRALGKSDFRCEGSPHLNIEVCAAYWRKANSIHRWFVENVQHGEDNCESYDVSREKLIELRDLCASIVESSELVTGTVRNGYVLSAGGKTPQFEAGRIVQDPTAAIESLPTTSGFFFGGTDYDESYISDLRSTISQIDRALAKFEDGWSFTYESSW